MNAARREIARFAAVLRDGSRLYRLAPAIPLIALVTEFIQHVVEIRLGLFNGRAQFNALAMDPVRMQAGYLKIAGLWIALLLAARYWANHRRGRPWWSMGTVAWRPLILALVLMGVTSIPSLPGLGLPPELWLPLNGAILVATIPLAVLAMAGLLGDDTATLGSVYRRGWGQGVRIIAFMLLAFIPLQALHLGAHLLALGKPSAMVWALMAADAAVIGLLASALGTAMHHAYAPPDLAKG